MSGKGSVSVVFSVALFIFTVYSFSISIGLTFALPVGGLFKTDGIPLAHGLSF
jgi:hypothetical protein